MASSLELGFPRFLLSAHSWWLRAEAGAEMSQGALFGFGCVIFFIVGTGAFLFAMMSVREAADRQRGVAGTTSPTTGR